MYFLNNAEHGAYVEYSCSTQCHFLDENEQCKQALSLKLWLALGNIFLTLNCLGQS